MGKPTNKKLKETKVRQKMEEAGPAAAEKRKGLLKNTISKKEKFSQKRHKLLNKFALLKQQQKEDAERRRREKTAIVGDLKVLKDALPSLEEIMKLSKEKSHLKTGIQAVDATSKDPKQLSTKKKIKTKKEKFARQVKAFEKLLKDPDFKRNPREAIRYHIKYTHGLIE
ncbi:ribosome biogenesis protein SLX9 homolog [Musca vetustissima]|uniref:ribosome biogenesis protein SLX9 homolog n=1 Tax=Musca vetustissima TaxID=27455 RepID=UPI002AB6CFBC|nr:ribosome biogenesis protein SLX9 homolog [Musca vetustissima]